MIARLWRGRTPARLADAYHAYLLRTGVAGFRRAAGHRGAFVLRRDRGDEAEFLVLSLWTSREAIAEFSGPDIDRPVYFPEDARYLLDLPDAIDHYDVLYPAKE